MNMNDHTERLKMFIKEHGWGPLCSVIFHMLMVLIVVNFAVNAGEDKSATVEVVMMETKADEPEPIKPAVEEIKADPINDVVSDIPSTVDAVTTTENFEMPGDPSLEGGAGGGTANFGIGTGDASDGTGFEMAFVKSPLVMRGLYAEEFGPTIKFNRASSVSIDSCITSNWASWLIGV